MSRFHTYQTQFKDEASLVDALKEVGCGVIGCEVEVHENAQPLIDFQGRRTHYVRASGDVANIIVRRRFVAGSSNDLGFVREKDGTFTAIISEYDSSAALTPIWLKNLTKSYVEKASVKQAKALGFKLVQKKTVDGRQQIELVR